MLAQCLLSDLVATHCHLGRGKAVECQQVHHPKGSSNHEVVNALPTESWELFQPDLRLLSEAILRGQG